ncbi:MAG TPA: hypothetical protein DC049_03060 [Spirochaetia bacterium]|nr:hypothetical protein [Spirochaetia bacterium]
MCCMKIIIFCLLFVGLIKSENVPFSLLDAYNCDLYLYYINPNKKTRFPIKRDFIITHYDVKLIIKDVSLLKIKLLILHKIETIVREQPKTQIPYENLRFLVQFYSNNTLINDWLAINCDGTAVLYDNSTHKITNDINELLTNLFCFEIKFAE